MSKSAIANDSLATNHDGLTAPGAGVNKNGDEGFHVEREKAMRLAKSVAMASSIPADGD